MSSGTRGVEEAVDVAAEDAAIRREGAVGGAVVEADEGARRGGAGGEAEVHFVAAHSGAGDGIRAGDGAELFIAGHGRSDVEQTEAAGGVLVAFDAVWVEHDGAEHLIAGADT